FVAADDRALSIWQSAVEAHLKKKLAADGQPPTEADIIAHPMMQAVNEHVEAEEKGQPVPPSAGVRSIGEEDYSASASQGAFWMAFPSRAPAGVRAIGEAGPSDSDLGEWAEAFAENSKLLLLGQEPQYIDSHGDMSVGVIPWKLADDATLVV